MKNTAIKKCLYEAQQQQQKTLNHWRSPLMVKSKGQKTYISVGMQELHEYIHDD